MHNLSNDHLITFQQHRPLLFSIAYRMLSSASEAEDILQDAYLRFREVRLSDIESPKSYLATIVTRLCLNHLSSARVKRETYPGPWLPEPVLSADHLIIANPEARASQYDSISMAFLTLLEHLTPAERAVFLLREVFDYEYAEIAEILAKSESACRKLFSRAKSYLSAHRPRYQASPEEHRRLLERLTTLLAEDASLWADGGGKVRGAALQPIHGRANVARFVIGVTERFMPAGARTEVVDVNGRPTLLIRNNDGSPAIVVSLEVEETRVTRVWVIANPDKLAAVL